MKHHQIAGSIALFYVFFMWAGMIFQYFLTGGTYTLTYSLKLPQTWIAAALGIAVGIGLIKAKWWSWWIGIFSASYLLLMASWRAARILYDGYGISWAPVVVIGLSVSFLIVLATPKARAECGR